MEIHDHIDAVFWSKLTLQNPGLFRDGKHESDPQVVIRSGGSRGEKKRKRTMEVCRLIEVRSSERKDSDQVDATIPNGSEESHKVRDDKGSAKDASNQSGYSITRGLTVSVWTDSIRSPCVIGSGTTGGEQEGGSIQSCSVATGETSSQEKCTRQDNRDGNKVLLEVSEIDETDESSASQDSSSSG